MHEIAIYLIIGVLSGLLAGLFGVGGGVVIVPGLIMVYSQLGMDPHWIPHLAVGTSLAVIVGTGLASTHAHHGRGAVRWDLVGRLVPGILVGAWLGAAIAGFISGLWLKRLFAVFLVVVAIRMLLPRQQRRAGVLPGTPGMWGAGAAIGTLSALVGIGGGTITVPFLSNRGVELRKSVATSAACGVPIAIAGAIGFMVMGWGREGLPAASTGFVYWPAVGATLLGSIPTAPLGARLAHWLPVKLLLRLFAALLLLVALRLMTGG